MSRTRRKASREPVSVRVCVQETVADCGIAAVAMISGEPYATVFKLAKKTAKRARKEGTSLRDVRKLGRAVGVSFRIKEESKVDLDSDTGIMWLNAVKGKFGHVTVLFRGVVIDPSNGQLWAPDTYLAENPEYKFIALLEPR